MARATDVNDWGVNVADRRRSRDRPSGAPADAHAAQRGPREAQACRRHHHRRGQEPGHDAKGSSARPTSSSTPSRATRHPSQVSIREMAKHKSPAYPRGYNYPKVYEYGGAIASRHPQGEGRRPAAHGQEPKPRCIRQGTCATARPPPPARGPSWRLPWQQRRTRRWASSRRCSPRSATSSGEGVADGATEEARASSTSCSRSDTQSSSSEAGSSAGLLSLEEQASQKTAPPSTTRRTVSTLGNYLGAKHTLGFKPQAAPGTPEATRRHVLPDRVHPDGRGPEEHRAQDLRRLRAGPCRRARGTISPKGKAKMEVAASQPHPWYWLLGGVASAHTGTLAYTHTITDAGDGILLTAEADRVFDHAKQADVKLDKLTLSGDPGRDGGAPDGVARPVPRGRRHRHERACLRDRRHDHPRHRGQRSPAARASPSTRWRSPSIPAASRSRSSRTPMGPRTWCAAPSRWP